MENNRLKLRQMIILFFIIGLMTSCAKSVHDNLTVRQLMNIKNIDFDNDKDLRQFVSKEFDVAQAWNHEEIHNGRIVSIKLNKETGEYICKSIPKGRVSLPAEDKILDLLDENGEFLLEDEE